MSTRIGQTLPQLPSPLCARTLNDRPFRSGTYVAQFDLDGDGKADAFLMSQPRLAAPGTEVVLTLLDGEGRAFEILSAVDGVIRTDELIRWSPDGTVGLSVHDADLSGRGRADFRHIGTVVSGRSPTLCATVLGLPSTAEIWHSYGESRTLWDTDGDGRWDKSRGTLSVEVTLLQDP